MSGGGIGRHVIDTLTPFEQNLLAGFFVILAVVAFGVTYLWMSRRMR